MEDNSMFEQEEYFEFEETNQQQEESTYLDCQKFEDEYDVNELFDDEDIVEYFRNKKRDEVPFSQLSTSEKGVPLEKVIRRYCISNKIKYDMTFKDLSKNKNHKKSKGILDVDFVINDFAAIEAKNWDCFAGNQYVVTKRDLNNQVLNKFTKYYDLKKILIIANPWWERDAIKYLMSKRLEIVEVGFQVTYDATVMDKAFWKIKPQLDSLLYIPYQQLQRLIFSQSSI